MVRVGIIGGIGPQSTSYFYNQLIKKTIAKPNYPKILLNSIDLNLVLNLLDNKKELIKYLCEEINVIQDKVDFIVIVCNTIHVVIEELRSFSKVPIIAIHEEVVKKINFSKKIGILGTNITVNGDFYKSELMKKGIESVILEDTDSMHNAIINYISGNPFNIHDELESNIKGLIDRGCDGIILACTELPLFLPNSGYTIKIYSSTDILVDVVLDKLKENFINTPNE